MQHTITLPDNKVAILVITDETIRRLANSCFRGTSVQRAGNFMAWCSFEEMLANSYASSMLSAALWNQEKRGTQHVTIEHHAWVGWSGTDKSLRYQPEMLESFGSGNGGMALRVKPDIAHAPITNKITFVYHLAKNKNEGEPKVVIIHSIYPGPYFDKSTNGENGLVLFDWENPGVRIDPNEYCANCHLLGTAPEEECYDYCENCHECHWDRKPPMI